MSDDSFDASTLGWIDLPSPVIISNQLRFFGIYAVYSADQDLTVTFAFLDGNIVRPGDFVGIYKTGIKDLADSILKVVVNPDIMSVTFPAAELPHDNEANYMVVYVRGGTVAAGGSAPFKILTCRPSTDDAIPNSNPSPETALSVDDVVSDAESEEFLVVHSQLQEENSRLKADLNRVLTSLAALKQEQEDAVIAFQKQIDKDKADMSRLQKELCDLKTEHCKVNTAADFAKAQLKQVRCYMERRAENAAELCKVKNDMENATNEKSALASRLSESEMREQKLQSTIKGLQGENRAAKEELVESRKILEDVTNEKLALADRLLKFEKQEQDLTKAMKSRAKSFAFDFNEMSLELIDTKEKSKKRDSVILELMEKIQELKSEIRQKDAKLSEDVNVILTYHARVQELSTDRDSGHTDNLFSVKFLKDTLDANVEMLQAVEASKQLAVAELATDKILYSKLQAEKTAKDKECMALKKKIDVLIQESSEAMKEKEAECQTLKAKCEELQHALLQGKEKVETEESECTNLRLQASRDKVALQQLNIACSKLAQKIISGLQEFHDAKCQLSATKLADEEAETQRLCNEDEQLEKVEQFLDALTDVNVVITEQPKNNEPKMETELVVAAGDDAERLLSAEREELTTEKLALSGNEAGAEQMKQVVEAGIDAENLCCKEVEEANAELKARLLEGAEIFKEQYQEVKGLKKEVKKLEILRKADEFHRKPFQPRGPVLKNMLMGMQRNYQQLGKKMPTVVPPAPALYVSDEEKAVCTPPEKVILRLIPRPVNDCDTGERVEKMPSLVPVEAEPLPKREAEPHPEKEAEPHLEKEAEPLPKQKTKLFKNNVAFSDETIFQLNHVVYENLPLPEISEDEAPLLYLISPTGLFERIMSNEIPTRIQVIIRNNEVLHPKLISEPFSTFPFSEEARKRFHEAPPKLEKIVRILEMHKTTTVSVATRSGFFVSIMLDDLDSRLHRVISENRAMRAYKKAYGKFGIPPMYIYKPAPPYENLKEYFENTDHCVRETLMGLRVGAQELFLLFPINKVFFPPPDSPFLDSNSENLAAEVCEIIEDMRKACVKSNYAYNESFMEPYRSLPRLSDRLRKPDFLPTTNNFLRPCVLQSRKASEATIGIQPASPVKDVKNGSEKPATSVRQAIGSGKEKSKKDNELQSYGDRCPIMPPAGASKRPAYQPIYPQLTDSLIDGGRSSERKKAASGTDTAPARPVSASAFYSACSEGVYPPPVPSCIPRIPPCDTNTEVAKCVNARLRLFLGGGPNIPLKTSVPDSPLDVSETSTMTKAGSCHTIAKPNVCVTQATSRASSFNDSLKTRMTIMDSWNMPSKFQSVWQDMPDSRSRPLIPSVIVPHFRGGFQPPLPQNPSVTTPLFNRGGFQQPLPQDPSMTPPHLYRGDFQQPLPQNPSMTSPHLYRCDFQQPLPQNPPMSALHLNKGDFQQPLPLKKSSVSTACQSEVDFQKPLPLKKSLEANPHISESGLHPLFVKDPIPTEMKLKNTSSEEACLYPPSNNFCELQFFTPAPIIDLVSPPSTPRPIVDRAVQQPSSNLNVTNTSVQMTNAWTPNYSNSVIGTTTVPVNPPYAHGNATDTWPLSSNLKPSIAAEQKDKKWTSNHLNSVGNTTMVPVNPPSAPVTASEMTTRPLSSDSKPAAASAEQKDKKKLSEGGNELQVTVWCPTCNLEIYDQDHLATLLKHMESSHKQTLCPICSDIYDLNDEAVKRFKVHVNSHFD